MYNSYRLRLEDNVDIYFKVTTQLDKLVQNFPLENWYG